jgi:excisionase family DNA binding protein
MNDNTLHKIPDVCETTNLSRSAVYALIRSGRLKSVSIGRARRVSEKSLREFLTELEKGWAR